MDAVAIHDGRNVRATLDGERDASRVVVACPPHPQYGGSRSDHRLTTAGDALVERDVACLRFDYGPWDEGRGEGRDAENALDWARDRFDAVGLFGYSFGAGVALHAASSVDPQPAAVCALAPDAAAAEALADLTCPVEIVYGERDDTVDWRPVVERAQARGHAVEGITADHHFVGQVQRVGSVVADFLVASL